MHVCYNCLRTITLRTEMVRLGHNLSRNAKIRAKGLSEADITLEQLLRYGRTLASTIQQSLVISNSVHGTSTTYTATAVAQPFYIQPADSSSMTLFVPKWRAYNSNKQNDPIDDALRGRHALASLPAGI